MGSVKMKSKQRSTRKSNWLLYAMGAFTRRLIRFLVWIAGFFVYPIVYLISLKKREKLPPIKNHLLLISATKLAHKIRNKEVKCIDVISAYIQRCKEVNPIINAIVEPRYDFALTEARNVDKLIQSDKHSVEELEKLYPLLGIPITVKESIAVAGMSNEAGRYRAKPTPAEEDAKCISQVRAAGAIVLLVSNTPELCMCWETYNYVTGKTKNPYDTRRTCGGSSGGEAALISSGASLVGVGSDIAGSLRLPAMYTGIFGHKPSPYAVSTEGHTPNCEFKEWNNFFILGPMTRYAEDLSLIASILNDADGPKLINDDTIKISNVQFYYMEGDNSGGTNKINSHMRMAIQKVIMHLKKNHKISPEKANLSHMKYAFDTSVLNLLRLDGVETIFSEPGNPSKWRSVTVEVFKKMFGCSKSTITCVLYGVLKKLSKLISEDKYDIAAKLNSNLRQEFIDLLKDNGVCIYPTFTRTATYHYDYFRHLTDYAYLFLFNSLGLPVVNCPVGFTTENMPVGVQVIASPGCDHLLFAVAKELQEAFGGWVPPSDVTEEFCDGM